MATNRAHQNGVHSLTFDKFYNTINGKLESTSERRHGINPSNLEGNAEVPIATKEDVDRTVEAAKFAGESWADVPIAERQQAVIKFAEALDSHKDAFAAMLVKEQGKPLMFASMEVDNAVRWLKVQAQIPFPKEVVEENDEKIVLTRYTPLGVALAIVPWNFLILLACVKIAPALVSGNALILKPSPLTYTVV